jgi:hypothetical protein
MLDFLVSRALSFCVLLLLLETDDHDVNCAQLSSPSVAACMLSDFSWFTALLPNEPVTCGLVTR